MNESLKLLRAQKKLSQSQVAEFIGVSRQMYIKYENGEAELSASSITKLCELYNVSADVILGILANQIQNEKKSKRRKFWLIHIFLYGFILPINDFAFSGIELERLSNLADLRNLPIESKHVFNINKLKYSKEAKKDHKDPFDQMLISQAKTERMFLLTHDELISNYMEECIIFA